MSSKMDKTISEAIEEVREALIALELSSQGRENDKMLQDCFFTKTETEQTMREKQQGQELELEYDKNEENERFLVENIEDKMNDMMIDQHLIEDYEHDINQLSQRQNELKQEVESIYEEIFTRYLTSQGEDPNSIERQLAFYRRMGVSMQVDNDNQIRRATLTSPDGNVHTLSLEGHNLYTNINTIWDLITIGIVNDE